MNKIEVQMGLKDRFLDCVYTLFSMWIAGIFVILWAPFAAFNAFMTKTKWVHVMYDKPKSPNPDDGESWKKQHDEEYS